MTDKEIKKTLEKDVCNFFVVAGAGTGKTTSMVERIAYMLEKRNIDAKTIVAISFTNNSAEDLREKIIQRVSGKRQEVDDIHISTIHSFCESILKENAIYANISPTFEVLNDDEDIKRKNKIFNTFFRRSSKSIVERFSDSSTSSDIYDDIKKPC